MVARTPEASTEEMFFFPDGPNPHAAEWDGTPIGAGNTVTRTKGRTLVSNKTVDAIPGRLEELVRHAEEHVAEFKGREPHHQHDVVIHGVRVRAMTNSEHLNDFWVHNWYSPEDWGSITGAPIAGEPQVTVYAYGNVAGEQEAAYYSRKQNTIVFFNTSYYGQLKSWVLGAVGRVLAEDYGIHSIHGACVERKGKGVLYIAPTGTGKSTSSYGLMTMSDSRFHSDDWVYVRYAYPRKSDGVRVAPLVVTDGQGNVFRGYEVFRWLERHAADSDAHIEAMTLDGQRVTLAASDLDASGAPKAYAYTSEKVFYLRSNIVESFPEAAGQLLNSKFENAPDVTDDFVRAHRDTLTSIWAELRHEGNKQTLRHFSGKSEAEIDQVLARMFAFDNTRAMLDIARVFDPAKVYTNPAEPVELACIFLLKRSGKDHEVLEHLREGEFISRLMIGETPEGKRETAYNAYRAVDDRAERALIDQLEQQWLAAREQGQAENLYPFYQELIASDMAAIPSTLYQEMELFRVMFNAARTYSLNTILMRDPRISNKREAVRLTIELIARTVDVEPWDVSLTLDDYRSFLQG